MAATIKKLKDGDQCNVVAGTHAGKSGIVGDINTSKTGHVTITVTQKNGVRFKTLARNVVVPRKTAGEKKKTPMDKGVVAYNKSQKREDREICMLLSEEISSNLPDAENKIWHAHPVWFLDANPIVGYSKLKDCIRLLFWSGQSFEEKDLHKEGTFKAAEARFTSVDEVSKKDLKRWLKKAKDIQWDYKNLIRRRGVLERLK